MIIKSIYCSDGGSLATSKAQRYITNELKVPPGGIFSYGCGVRNWSSINTAVKIIYNKKDRGRYYHYIIGFDPADKVDEQKALKIGEKIALHWKDRYVLGAVHNNTGHIHLHILVSYTTIDGKQKGMGGNDLNDFKSYVSRIAEAEGCCKVRMYNNTVQKHTDSISDSDTDAPEFEIPDTEYLADPQTMFGEEVIITHDTAGEKRNELGDRQIINRFYTTNNYYNFWAPTTFNQAGRYGNGNYNRTNQQYPALTGSAGNGTAMSYAPAGNVPLLPAAQSAPVLSEVTVEDTQSTCSTIEYRVNVTYLGKHVDPDWSFSYVEEANAYAAQYNNIPGCRACVYTAIDGIVNPFVSDNP